MTHSITELLELANHLVKAPGLLPKHARTVHDILAITLAGQELGYGPMSALRNLQLVSGKLVLTADAMLGLMVKAGIKVKWESDGSNGVAELHLRRGDETHVQRWSESDRKAAGLSSATWKSYAPAMLRARCVSAAARAFAADVLGGSYIPGEHPDDRKEEGPGELDALPDRSVAKAEKLPEAGEKALSLAAAQGFVPSHPIALDPFLAVDLQQLDNEGSLIPWLKEAIARAGNDKAAKAYVWHAFSEHCASLELAPNELLQKMKAQG